MKISTGNDSTVNVTTSSENWPPTYIPETSRLPCVAWVDMLEIIVSVNYNAPLTGPLT